MPVLGEEVERAAAPVDEDPPQLRAGGADLRCGARRVRRRGRNAQPICERQGGGDGADRENQALHLVLLPDAGSPSLRMAAVDQEGLLRAAVIPVADVRQDEGRSRWTRLDSDTPASSDFLPLRYAPGYAPSVFGWADSAD